MLVKRMWNVYRHRSRARLPRFWLEAFKAAYEYLTSEVPEVRDVAVSEIAKMSVNSIDVDSLPSRSTVSLAQLAALITLFISSIQL